LEGFSGGGEIDGRQMNARINRIMKQEWSLEEVRGCMKVQALAGNGISRLHRQLCLTRLHSLKIVISVIYFLYSRAASLGNAAALFQKFFKPKIKTV
jgi:hypothetical protein